MENIEYQYEVLKWHRQQILKKKVLTNNDHDIRYRIEHLLCTYQETINILTNDYKDLIKDIVENREVEKNRCNICKAPKNFY